jgi:IS30 family transposase
VAQKLALQWSPEQISGWLKQQFPTDRDMRISHEAIYRSLFVQTRGVLKKELTAQLRTRRQMRHAKGGKAKNGQGHILDMVSIRERPAEAEDRAVLAIGKEIFLPEQATRTSRRSSNATAALRCSSSFQGRTRRLWLPRSLSTSANCPSSYDAP